MTMPTRKETAPALLRVLLQLGGEAPARDVIPLVTDEFPQITEEDLTLTLKNGSSKWKNRVYWARQDMLDAGRVASPRKGVWALTDQGRADGAALAQTPTDLTTASAEEPAAGDGRAPLLAQASAPESGNGDGQPPAPTTIGLADDEDAEPAAPDEDDDAVAPRRVTVLPNESDRIIAELQDSATDSSSPARLETAVTDALLFLGFDAQRIGGPGQTDVLAVAHLGVDRYTVVIDAKSTASGKVGDQQVDWDSIVDHREKERADHSCIIGPRFAAGNLRERAEKHDTRLLTTDQLADVVRTHADSPISLKTLQQVFNASIDAATAVRDVQAASEENNRRRRLPLKLVGIIDQVNRTKTTAVAAKADSLWFALAHASDDDSSATLEEIEAALALLETLGVLRRSNGEGYVSQTSLSGAEQMLDAAPTDESPPDDDPAEEQDASAI